MKRRMLSMLMLVILLLNVLAVPAQAVMTEYHINFNEQKKIYLSTSKSVYKAEWSTSNAAIVDIVDSSTLSCTVVGVDNQKGQSAVITCHYWYYLGGSVFQDYENFRVYVPSEGSGSSSSTSSGSASSAKLRITPASVKLDLAKKETAQVKVSISGYVNYPWDIICNGAFGLALHEEVRRDTLAVVFEFETYRNYVGTRNVEFYLFDTSTAHGDNVGTYVDDISLELEVYCSHKWELDEPSVEVTCTQDGKITQKICSVCKATQEVEEIIPAPGHSFGEWEVYQEPTAQAEGIARRTCGCGAYEEQPIDKLPSDPDSAPTEPSTTEPVPSEPVDPETGFADVPAEIWYHEPVRWAVAEGITNGTSDTTFTPDGPCTRAQAVTFLYRAAGCPAYEAESCPFTDVQAEAYYYDAVMWAVEKGITIGTSETTFSPEDTCTRAQIVTLLWRSQGCPIPAGGENPFADVAADAYYAVPVLWAVEKGITNGISEITFAPDDPCTRAQIVTFLHRAQ